ncbi:MAG: hypothetical protein ACYS8W_09080 [Planctomycetota bacterium]|jgi:hypothetical protein
MQEGYLSIKAVYDIDEDLQLEIYARNERFAGSCRLIYWGYGTLDELAAKITGFPERIPEERKFEFGTRDPKFAGGYCGLRFLTEGGTGKIKVEIEIEDDTQHYSAASAQFAFTVEPSNLDKFVLSLRSVEKSQGGEVILGQK